VHEPIIVSVALLIGTTVNPLPVLVIGVPLSLAAAQVFFVLVERHAHNFSRWTGSTIATKLARTPSDHADVPPSAVA
jgi:peptidoglycan/LPS O-acetylase OafA/YrhL